MSIRSLSRGFAILCLLGSGAVWAGKPPPPPPPPSGSACVNMGGDFPAMAYSRGVFAKSGTYQRTQFFVANSLGNCEVMVYDTADYNGRPVNPSFHFDFGTSKGTLAWQQLKDNGNTPAGRVVKVAQFTVTNQVVDGLPLTATTIYRFPTSLNTAIEGVALSSDGGRVAFSEEHQAVSTDPWTLQVLICAVSAPATSSACQASLEPAFTVTSTAIAGGTHELTIGLDGGNRERIYFIYRPGSASVGIADLVAVDRIGFQDWTPPNVVVDREQQYINNPLVGDTKTYLDTPSALSGTGSFDRILLSSRNGTSARARVDIFDTAPIGGGLTHDVGTGYRPSWTMKPSIDSQALNVLATKVLSLQPSAVQEIHLDGTLQTSLPAQGYGVDSAN